MRRPLVLCGLLFSVLLLLLLQIRPLWWSAEQKLPEKTVRFEGVLYEKEYRIQAGETVPVFYLKNVSLYDVMPQSGGEAGGSLPKEIPYKLMCYMEQDAPYPRAGAGQETEPVPGSRVILRGKIRNFRSATNDGEFDSAKYYQILGIGASVTGCTVEKQYGSGSALKNRLYDLKEYAGLLLHAVLNEEDASVMGSLLLGESALLDRDTKDLYRRSGIIHILAISGLHISLIGMGLFKILKKCFIPTLFCAAAAASVVFLFGLMTGFGPSSMRAVIMFLMQMTAFLTGRTYDLPTGLSAAAILVMGMQPLYLYHSGFMLSFVSVASLAVLQPVFANLFPKKLSPGMAIFVGTLPVHAWFYYEASPYAVILNLVVVPCMPVLMILGGLVLLFGAVWLPLTVLPAKGIHALLYFYRLAGSLSLKIPGHSWVTGKPALYQVILYLTILVIIAFLAEKVPVLWGRMGVCLAVLVLASNFHAGLQITAVDVGQGDCFYVTDHRGTHLLIDGGSSSKKNVGTYQIEPALKYYGTQRLNAVFVSHLDADHYNGILELVELSDEGGVEIERVFVSGAVAADVAEVRGAGSSEAAEAADGDVCSVSAGTAAGESGSGAAAAADGKYGELAALAAAHGISVEVMPQGSIYRSGKLDLACLYPSADKAHAGTDETNENSMVLYLRCGEFTALFTGDLEGRGEDAVAGICRELLGSRRLTLLKVAHHGSKNSTSADFLEALRPALALISAGAGNSYGHPHEATLSRLEEAGARIFRTDECGEIMVRVNGGKVSVRRFVE